MVLGLRGAASAKRNGRAWCTDEKSAPETRLKRDSLPACAVLLAGGRGTRFWPRSRMRTPKQLLNIVGFRNDGARDVGASFSAL